MTTKTTARREVHAASGRRARRPVPAVAAMAAMAVVAVAAACGSSTPSSSGTTTTAAAPGASGTTTTAAGTMSRTVADATSNAKIGGVILVTTSGHTLYELSADTSTQSVCNGGCASEWPPLTVPAATTPGGGPGASGTFGTITRSDGSLQVTYDGHPLYTFAGDSSAGSTNGQDISSDGGKWTVVTVGGKSTPASPTTTRASSGGGY